MLCCVQAAHPCLPQAQGPQRRTRARDFFHLHAPKPRDLHVRASPLVILRKTDLSDNSSVKFGTLTQSPVQVLANLETALPAIIAAVRGGWDNVQSLNIKTTKSLSLPIWSCKLGTGEGARWHGLTLEDEEREEDDETAMPRIPNEVKTTKTTKAKKHPPDRGKKPAAASAAVLR